MRKPNKKILIPVLIAALCFVAIAAVTLVLLLGKEKDGGHIVIEEGGNATVVRRELEISLVRERLEMLTLDENGLPVPAVDESTVDFTNRKDNVFGIDENMLIGPACYFSAHMAIENLKPYAFEYWLEIIPQNGETLLAEQLMLTVKIGDETFVERTLQGGLATAVFPRAESGETARFTVQLEYLDVNNNDLTKNTTLAFDMVVHAKLAES